MSHTETVLALVGTLFLLAIVAAIRFEMVLLLVESRLRRAAAALEGIQDSAAFACRFEAVCTDVRNALTNDDLLLGEWDACSNGFLVADGTVTSVREPGEFFHASKVLNRAGLAFYRHLPGVLVGLGLVFTFFGISVVIYQASEGLKNPEDITALQGLLSAAALKFWTSLTGVALSLACGMHYRERMRPASGLVSAFGRRLSVLAPVAGQQRVLEAITLLRSDIGNIAQDAMERFLKKSTSVLRESIDRRMAQLDEPIERLTLKLDALSAAQTDLVIKVQGATIALARAAESLNGSVIMLTEAIGENGKKVREDFASAASSAADARKNLAAAAEDADRTGKSILKARPIAEKLEAAANVLARLEGLAISLTGSGDHLSKASDQLATLWEEYSRRMETLDLRVAESLHTLPTVFDQYANALGAYTRDLDTHLEATLARIMEWVQHIAELQRTGSSSGSDHIGGHSPAHL